MHNLRKKEVKQSARIQSHPLHTYSILRIKGSPLATAQLVIANTAMCIVGLTVAMRTFTFPFPDSFYRNNAIVKRFEVEE